MATVNPRAHEILDQSINFTRLDDRVYSNAIAEGDAVGALAERVGPEVKNAIAGGGGGTMVDRAVFDAFNCFHRAKPKPSGFGSPLLSEIARRVMETPEIAALRRDTVGDSTASVLSSLVTVEETLKAIDKDTRDAADREEKARKEAADAKAYAELIAEDGEASDDEVADANRDAVEKKEAAQAAAADLREFLAGAGKKIAAAAAQGVAKARESVEPIKAIGAGLNPGTGCGDPTGGFSPADKFRLARAVARDPKRFKLIADAIGRMTRDADSKQRAKMVHDAGSIVDIGIGSDLDLLMEDEIVMLRHPKLSRLALARIADDSAMVYSVEQRDEVGRGPIIACLDESGSMSGAKEAQAKGIALALAHVAVLQKRPLYVLFFQSQVTLEVVIEPGDAKRVDDKGRNLAVSKLATIAERGTAGGTDFSAPVRRAANLAAGHKTADVLFLTDGAANADSNSLAYLDAVKAANGTRIYTMLIGGEAASSKDEVAKFSDKVWVAEEVFGAASELFSIL